MNESLFNSKSVCAAIETIEAKRYGLLVLKDGEIIYSSSKPGIGAALEVYDTLPTQLKDAVVVDRIIGRAAAMIFAHGGAAAVYGSVMSTEAKHDLEQQSIQVMANKLVEKIINRAGNGQCPMELAVQNILDPIEGIETLRNTLHKLTEDSK